MNTLVKTVPCASCTQEVCRGCVEDEVLDMKNTEVDEIRRWFQQQADDRKVNLEEYVCGFCNPQGDEMPF